MGRTVAELGAMNQPLDMVSFVQGGEEHLLVANTSHGLVKIACRDIDVQAPLTEPSAPIGTPPASMLVPEAGKGLAPSTGTMRFRTVPRCCMRETTSWPT